MNKKLLLLLLPFITISKAIAFEVCTEKDSIIKIAMGDVERGRGTDNGHNIYVTTKNLGEIPVNWSMNLNDGAGNGFLSTIQTAMALNLKVTLVDRRRDNCNSFSELIMEK